MTEIELTRRRILAGVLVIGLAAAAAGVGTFALFSDEVQSDNSINAGTLDLSQVDANLSVDDLHPTESTTEKTITTTYSATTSADLSLDVSVSDSPDGFAEQLEIETAELTVGGDTLTTFDGNTTLADMEGSYDNVSTLSDEDNVELVLEYTLARDTGNQYQGASVDIGVTFNATQQT